VCIGDAYFFSVAKQLVGKPAASISFLFYFINFINLSFLSRTLGNSVESILCTVTLYYFLRTSGKIDLSTVVMTGLLTLAFIIRNTAPIGWVPLLLIRILRDRAFLSYLISGFLIAIPLLIASIAIDTWFYGELTITAYNFFRVNVFEGLSVYFGTSPWHYYLRDALPMYLNIQYPIALYAFYTYTRDTYSKN